MAKMSDGTCGCDATPGWIDKINGAVSAASTAESTAASALSQIETAAASADKATAAATAATAAAEAATASIADLETTVDALTKEIPNDVRIVNDGAGVIHAVIDQEDGTALAGPTTRIITAGANVTIEQASDGSTRISSIAGGGSGYVAGYGIDITGNEIAVDETAVLTEASTGLESSIDESGDALISLSINGSLDSVGIRPGEGITLTQPATDIVQVDVSGYVPTDSFNTAITSVNNDVSTIRSNIEVVESSIDELEMSKQDALTAGSGISISDNVISATADTWTQITSASGIFSDWAWTVGDKLTFGILGNSSAIGRVRYGNLIVGEVTSSTVSLNGYFYSQDSTGTLMTEGPLIINSDGTISYNEITAVGSSGYVTSTTKTITPSITTRVYTTATKVS